MFTTKDYRSEVKMANIEENEQNVNKFLRKDEYPKVSIIKKHVEGESNDGILGKKIEGSDDQVEVANLEENEHLG